MNPSNKFYRFFYWAITLLVLGALPVVVTEMLWATEQNPAPEANLIRLLFFAVAGIAFISLNGYILLNGKIWAKGLVVSLHIFAVCWLMLEGLAGLALRWKAGSLAVKVTPDVVQNGPISIRQQGMNLIAYDSLGIKRIQPGAYQSVYTTKRPNAGTDTVTITYHIDSLFRRVTPFSSRQSAGDYALFLGCSFTYGESVDDSATLPYYFGQQTGYRPYNYGVSGYSPAHVLALLQTVNLRKEVAEKNGIAFYTYIDDHLARTNPSTRWAYNSNGYLPNVNPDKVIVEGTYAQNHPVRLNLIRWMYKSNIAQLLKINFPRQYSVEQYRRFVNIVRKTKDLYRQQFGNDNFYVVVFPAYPIAPELRQLFGQAGLKLLDYSGLLTWATAHDGMHPDSQAYRRVAKKLGQDLHLQINAKSSAQSALALRHGHG